MSKDEKVKNIAKRWIKNIVRSCFFDCCDSMRQEEVDRAKFEGLVDDKINIEDYVLENLKDFYRETVLEEFKSLEECGMTYQELMDNDSFASDLPIPFGKVL